MHIADTVHGFEHYQANSQNVFSRLSSEVYGEQFRRLEACTSPRGSFKTCRPAELADVQNLEWSTAIG